MKSYHIHIKGRVQGIGYRPFIYSLALKSGWVGTVSNTLDGVHIIMNCELCSVSKFVKQIRELSPKQSLITDIHTEEIEYRAFSDFKIVDSNLEGAPDLLITPDFAICDQCKSELFDPGNRRFEYPFITCTCCGPRFSIETALPYDRQRTSMETFRMCSACTREYHDPTDERFYAQTNTCPDCKISQWVVDATGNKLEVKDEKVIDFACRKIREGNSIAVKGIGGFLLICDACDQDRVLELRKKKHRPSKPFALLYPDLESIKKDFILAGAEEEELTGAKAPIVLLEPKENPNNAALLPTIAPGLDRLGVMIPYAPVLLLIARKLNRPLVATSGNIKGSPIIYSNEEAVGSLSNFADYIVLNNRDIQVPQDDSVVKFSRLHKQKVIIRRSRGYAPGLMQRALDPLFDDQVLAMGALLKSTFSIWNRGRCHTSQFLGDTTEFDAQISFEKTLKHFMNMLQFRPEAIIVDKHPAYFTTQFGRELAASYEIPVVEIQHHKAHLWAVLAENNLLGTDEKILGAILDGTGMGSDGAVWGGEFFIYEGGKLSRTSHLKYYPHILGDKMAYEPRLSALSLLHATNMNFSREKDHFTEDEIEFYRKVLENSSLCTSSVGRIFDAVSSLLDFCHINTYEGEAAMYLERSAQEFIDASASFHDHYSFELMQNGSIELSKLVTGILDDVMKGVNRGKISAKFHNTLVRMIESVAQRSGVRSIAFSGGVFQNGLLLDLIIEELGSEFNLYFHKELSPNDECISYGQLVGYYAKRNLTFRAEKNSKLKSLV